jgi:hypothetical protein
MENWKMNLNKAYDVECALINEGQLAEKHYLSFMVRINPVDFLKRPEDEIYATFPLGEFRESFLVAIVSPVEANKKFKIEKVDKTRSYRGVKVLFGVEPCDVGPLVAILYMDSEFKVTVLPKED